MNSNRLFHTVLHLLAGWGAACPAPRSGGRLRKRPLLSEWPGAVAEAGSGGSREQKPCSGGGDGRGLKSSSGGGGGRGLKPGSCGASRYVPARRLAGAVLSLLAVTAAGCRGGGEDLWQVDVSKARTARLDALATDLRIIPLRGRDSVCTVGEVYAMKCYGDRQFLYNERTRSIQYYVGGVYAGELDRAGRGPEEYGDIGTFAFDAAENCLVLFDRNDRTLKFYDCATNRMVRDMPLDYYVGALEHIAGSRFLAVRENTAPNSSDAAVLILDLRDGGTVARLPITSIQSGLLTDLALTRERPGSLLMMLPGAVNVLYRVDGEGFAEVARIGFGRFGASRRFWEGRCDDPFYLEEWLTSGRPAAIAPSLAMCRDDRLVFWYVSRYGTLHELPGLSLVVMERGEQRIVGELLIEGVAERVQPMCASEGRYFALIQPGAIRESTGACPPLAADLAAAAAASGDPENPLLLTFKL